MAIIDLYSRYVLKWSISNTMDADWCGQVLAETLAAYPAPEIFNTDQVRVSMDGKGRALDNIFVERLWRTSNTKIFI